MKVSCYSLKEKRGKKENSIVLSKDYEELKEYYDEKIEEPLSVIHSKLLFKKLTKKCNKKTQKVISVLKIAQITNITHHSLNLL